MMTSKTTEVVTIENRFDLRAVKDEFECEYIGEIDVKGKGKMEVWHLLAKKEERSLSHA